nr:type II secretion system minor pseudopilin GspI [Pantoea sp.]
MTLLEVMVALTIFSLAALALMKSLALGGRESARLTAMLNASWVAENALLEGDSGSPARQQSVWMVDGAWLWQESVAIDEGEAARRIAVAREDDPHTLIYQLLLESEVEQTP